MLSCRSSVCLCVLKFYVLFYVNTVQAKLEYRTFKVPVVRSTSWDPSIIDKTCLLKPDIGPCRAEISMYYFNPKMKNCTLFSWGGCQGNGNRFDTRRDCISSCLSRPNQPKVRPKWCDLSFDYGFCFGALKRWYYDPLWKVCKERIYSGCGGNKNNFYNEAQCDKICRIGTGKLGRESVSKSSGKKLIINPWNATKRKGKIQEIPTTPNSTIK